MMHYTSQVAEQRARLLRDRQANLGAVMKTRKQTRSIPVTRTNAVSSRSFLLLNLFSLSSIMAHAIFPDAQILVRSGGRHELYRYRLGRREQ